MKSNSKKTAAAITAALTEAVLVKSSAKKIMKRIDDTAKKMVKKINKGMAPATGKIKKNSPEKKQKKVPKAGEEAVSAAESLITV